MKLKGKLILSCAALAAVATTAFSTTYAWYTSNATVTATGLTARTQTDASDSLQISKDGTNWGTNVDLSEVITEALGNNVLIPVQRTANNNAKGTFNLVGEDETAPGSGSAATGSTGVVQFDLYFRNVSKDGAVYLNAASYSNTTGITSTQTTAVLPSTKLIADLNTTYTTAQNAAYTVDLMRALDVEIFVETGTVKSNTAVVTGNVGKAKEDGEGNDVTAGTGYAGVSANAYTLESATYSDTLQGKSDWDALSYYNAVKGTSVERPAGYVVAQGGTANALTAPTSTLASIANTNNGLLANTTTLTVVHTVWTLYLDGWDAACYDAVKSQKFGLDLTFNTAIAA